ncbi:hypothetical protein ACIPY2_05065 [Paenarthrobacter sp. NPDC089675]|uniref:hypothetical protein n=1 Tax=Paenarthrobacter sp. NPDC089675 TaxID=3364376 RepID=UPI00381B261E
MNARVFAYLSYPDACAALRWLEQVEFTTVRRHDGTDGDVVHAEVYFGDAVIMLASDDVEYTRPPLVGRSIRRGGNGVPAHTNPGKPGKSEACPPAGRAQITGNVSF